jgi:hypothetical protein
LAQRVRTALGYGLFVFLFLLIFRPFGLENMRIAILVKATCWYGVVCFGVLLSWFLAMPRLFPTIFQEARWTVWKEILHTLACILAVCIGNILFTHFYFQEPLGSRLVLRFLWWTFAVSVLPVILMVLLRQISLMKKFSRQAAELDRQLTLASPPEGGRQQEPAIPGQSQSQSSSHVTGEHDSHPSRDFLYAEAADNYVKVFYTADQQLIRSTLKQLEESFQGNSRIFRCHRTFLVNLDKVVHISGNAQGYKLHMERGGQVIPVSRSLNGQIASLVMNATAVSNPSLASNPAAISNPSLDTRPKNLPDRPGDL